MNSFKGKVHVVFEEQKISDRFVKREFVLKSEKDGQFGPMISTPKFQLVQEKCAIINQFPVGTEVEAFFDLRGREWEKDGVTSYFTNLEVWKIEPVVAETATTTTPDTHAQNPPNVTPAATPPVTPAPGLDSFEAGGPNPGHDQPNLPFSK